MHKQMIVLAMMLLSMQNVLTMQIRNKTKEDIKYDKAMSRERRRGGPFRFNENATVLTEWERGKPGYFYVIDAAGKGKTFFDIKAYPQKLLMDETTVFDVVKKGDSFAFQYVPGSSDWVNSFFKSVRAGDLKAVQQFLKEGMDPNIQDKNGETAVMIAKKMGNDELAKLFPQPVPAAPTAPLFPSQLSSSALVAEERNIPAGQTKQN